MTDASATGAPRKKSMIMPLILGLILCAGGAAAGFFGVSSGMLGLGRDGGDLHLAGTQEQTFSPATLERVAFIALDPLIISLPPGSERDYLRFAAQLEVAPDHVEGIEAIRPRIVDVLNDYLRAVDPADLADPAALIRLRAQILRRLQVVAGEGRIRDLLIMELVLN